MRVQPARIIRIRPDPGYFAIPISNTNLNVFEFSFSKQTIYVNRRQCTHMKDSLALNISLVTNIIKNSQTDSFFCLKKNIHQDIITLCTTLFNSPLVEGEKNKLHIACSNYLPERTYYCSIIPAKDMRKIQSSSQPPEPCCGNGG